MTRFRRIFADLHAAPGNLVCMADTDQPLTRKVEALSVPTFLDRLSKLI